MRELGLEYLSVFGLGLEEYVDLAGDLGCNFISLNLGGAANRLPQYQPVNVRGDASSRRELVRALADRGLRLALMEGFAITPTGSVAELARDLDLVAEMGAAAICVVSIDKDVSRTHDQFARMAEMAAERGLVATTEVGAGVMRNLPTALSAVAAVANPSFKLLIDTMHFFRKGATVADLASVDPSLIAHVQLCDVPMPAVIENYLDEALYERRAPGDGDLPLAKFLALVPETTPIGLEIPIRSLAEAGLGPHDRLRLCVERARELIAGSTIDQ
jgi:sugar phosphate isomerase/epimerase